MRHHLFADVVGCRFGEPALPVLVANGVVGVRDMGGDLAQIDGWRRRISAGELVGPTIVRAGPVVDGPKEEAEYRLTVTDAQQARAAVRQLKRLGVDFIKIHSAVPRIAYFPLLEEAKRARLPVIGHVPKEVTPAEASDAGQSGIEHMVTLVEGTFRKQAEASGGDLLQATLAFEQQEAAALFRRFAGNRTWFTPTLVATRASAATADSGPSSRPELQYVPERTWAYWNKYFPIPPPEVAAQRKQLLGTFLRLVKLMRAQGVGLLAGTDVALRNITPGFSLHDELELLVEAGLTPAEALRTATSSPARFLGHERSGGVATGKVAELVLLDDDPFADIGNTRRIHGVMTNGRYYTRQELDKLLEQAAAEAQK